MIGKKKRSASTWEEVKSYRWGFRNSREKDETNYYEKGLVRDEIVKKVTVERMNDLWNFATMNSLKEGCDAKCDHQRMNDGSEL